MSSDDVNGSLSIVVGELLYKNQLLREAIASKDEAVEMLFKHLMSAATSSCSCGLANHLTSVRNALKEGDVEMARRELYHLSEFCDSV